jgi:hypothetical protein
VLVPVSGWDDASASARDAGRSPHVALESTQHSLGFLEFGPIRVDEAAPLRVEPPPALETPQALIADPEAWDARAGTARLAGLEVEKALEAGGLTRPVGLAFAAVEEDHARRARADVVGDPDRPRSPPGRPALAASVTRGRATLVAHGRCALGLRATALGLRRSPLRSASASSSAARSAPR